MYKDYKVGDKVRVVSVEVLDNMKGIKIGDVFTIKSIDSVGEFVIVNYLSRLGDPLHMNQIELAAFVEPNQFNFITKRQLTEHLQKVITFYEDYTSDLLKETARDYREDIIDLKETGYEYRLELDKILIQVEELS